MLEKILAATCAPAFAGIKPSNIASVRKSLVADIHKEISALNGQLNKKDIYIIPLCECSKRVLVMVYRKKLLEQHLKCMENRIFLYRFGYDFSNDTGVDDYIEVLKQHLALEAFPHEIGVFLGYPLYDIECFIESKDTGCLMTGEWKVYHDRERAEKLFCRYKKCRRALSGHIEKGRTLAQIFCA